MPRAQIPRASKGTATVVLPPMLQANPALAPAYTTGQVRRLTGLTASHIASLWRMKALAPEVRAPQGRGHDLLFSLRNIRQLVILRSLLAGGWRMREALRVIQTLDSALVVCEAGSWLKGVLVPQFDADRRRAARNPHAFWATQTLRWLAEQGAVLVVRRVQRAASPRVELDVRIVQGHTPIRAAMPATGGAHVMTAQLVDVATVWHIAGELPEAVP